jgi:methionyl aminopeptidase
MGGFTDTFPYTGKVRPGQQSPKRIIPSSIPRPDYADDGRPKARPPILPWQVEIKTAEDVKGMRVAGRIAREVLDAAGRMVAPGVKTDAIDALVTEETIKRGAYPSPLNYHHFPKSCCTSVNEVICHGIPDTNVLNDGDIVNIDVTCYYGGYHGDCSETFLVGEVDEAGRQLVKVTHDCWQAAIDYCAPGKPFSGIGAVIEDAIRPYGYSTVREFCGHGIGKVFHTTPNILHYKNSEPGKMQAARPCPVARSSLFVRSWR